MQGRVAGTGFLLTLGLLFSISAQAATTWYPSSGGWASWAFEDLWPSKGDYDFNDLVVQYRSVMDGPDADTVTTWQLTVSVVARGARNHSGFGVELPVPAASVHSATLASGCTNAALTREDHATSVAFLLFDDSFGVLPAQPDCGNFANTQAVADGCTAQDGREFTLSVTFSPAVRRDALLTGQNPFLFRTDDPRHTRREVHLAGYAPTPYADMAPFSATDDDDATDLNDLAAHPYYLTAQGLPWALDIPVPFAWMQEQIDVLAGYPDFASWARSSGVDDADWFARTPAGGSAWNGTVSVDHCDWCVQHAVTCPAAGECTVPGSCVHGSGFCNAPTESPNGTVCTGGFCMNGTCIQADVPVTGLRFWLDAGAAATLFQDAACSQPVTSDGDPVGCWKDRSPAGLSVVQTTPTYRPLRKTGQVNGQAVVRFDGNNDYLNGGDILDIGTNDWTVFVVEVNRGTTGYFLSRSYYAGAIPRWAFGHDYTYGALGLQFLYHDINGLFQATAATVQGTYEIEEAQGLRTAGTLTIHKNGGVDKTNQAGNTSLVLLSSEVVGK